jgi:ABC-type nitrate/sulfonate/bicarbonate transport system permease component
MASTLSPRVGGAVGAAPEARRWAPALRRVLRAAWPPALALALILGAWEAWVRWRDVDPTVLPAPSAIAQAGWAERGPLASDTWVTLSEAVLGLLLALAAAIVLGLAIDGFAWVRRSVYPLLVASQTLPIVAIAPLVVIWWGYDLGPHVAVAALYTFFPIVVGLVQGLATSDVDANRLVRSMGAGRVEQLRRVRLPSALPSLFTGLKVAVTYAVVAAVIAGYVGAVDGLGIAMLESKNAFRTDLVFAAVVVTALLTLALFALVALVERALVPWARRGRRW